MIRFYPNEQVLQADRRVSLYRKGLGNEPVSEDANRFVQYFKEATGIPSAYLTPSARMAFQMILRSLSLPAGSEVMLGAYNFFEIPNIIRQEGYKPVYVDNEPVAARIDVDQMVEQWNPDCKMMMITHLFGVASDTGKVTDALRDKCWVLEDCAHAPLSKVDGHGYLGTKGHASFISFDRLKLVNAIRGGIVLTDNEQIAVGIEKQIATFRSPTKAQLAKKVLLYELENLLRNPLVYGLLGRLMANENIMSFVRKHYRSANRGQVLAELGFSDLQASLGLQMIQRMESIKEKRHQAVDMYLDLLEAKVQGEEKKKYVQELKDAFGNNCPSAYGLIVLVSDPFEVSEEARRLGYEVLREDRIAEFSPDPSLSGMGKNEFPGAWHLCHHAIKLPLIIGGNRDRYFQFADQITDLLARRLLPMESC